MHQENYSRVLVAEENKNVLSIIKAALEKKLNVQLDVAEEGNLVHIMVTENEYDLIIMNATLPGYSGLELTKYIRGKTRNKECRIILLASKARVENMIEMFDAGADAVVPKPFDLYELIARVRTQLRINQLQKKLKERNSQIENDLDTARRIQLAMLPVSLPKDPRFTLTANYLSMEKVGGDLYNITQLDDDRYAFLIGDILGHGVPAAFIMSMVMMMFQTLTEQGLSPAGILQAINTKFSGKLIDEYYFTAAYGIVDFSNRTFTISRGGHPSPAIYRKKEDRIELTKEGGMMLGRFPEAVYEDETFTLGTGDKILFYTDGVYEMRNPEGYPIQIKKFHEIFKTIAANASGNDLLGNLKEKCLLTQKNSRFEDDMTLLLIELL